MYNQERLTKLKRMNELAPEVMKAFWVFDKAAVVAAALRAGGAVVHATHDLSQ